jgi:hypothetical protein
MNRLGRSTSHHSAQAPATVRWRVVDRGSTWIDTRPSTPAVVSAPGAALQAHRTSNVVSSRSA